MQHVSFTVQTTEREQIAIVTGLVNDALLRAGAAEGICTIIVPHTTCAISVNENADPDVPTDMIRALRALVPSVRFEHGEGNSDAHFLSMLIGTSLHWPYQDGRLKLGRWQGIYFIELDGPRRRTVDVYVPTYGPTPR